MEIGLLSCVVEVLWYQKFVASSGPTVGRVKSNYDSLHALKLPLNSYNYALF